MFDQMDMGKTGLVVAENAVDVLQDGVSEGNQEINLQWDNVFTLIPILTFLMMENFISCIFSPSIWPKH
jgi:hypothetical protein